MALLRHNGDVIYTRNGVTYVAKHNAKAELDLNRPAIVTDRESINNKKQRKVKNLLERIARRKELKEMRRTAKNGCF